MHRRRMGVIYTLLCVLLLALMLANLCIGSVNTAPGTLLAALRDPDANTVTYRILMQIRLPRMLCAAVLGGGLAVSGLLLQSFFQNPIAGPYILGISSGAKLAAALLMVAALTGGFALRSLWLVGAAFVGAMLSMGLVLLVASKVHRMSVLIVCGVMIGYICSSVTDFVVNFSDDANIVNLHNWSMGSFSGSDPRDARIACAIVLPAVTGAFLLAKPMDAYRLGEQYARSSGVAVRPFRVALILLSSLLSAAVTAFAGPISFVGVAVPHLVKTLLHTAKPIRILPACFLGGAVFCLFCDLVTRTLFAPTELSISSVTALFGAPVVIAMLLRREGGHSDV
ncbi:MAG: iron ABC transporter permease [Oscillospiraceae bacterium]|nr:iron ABC transporter permease [Oscillospiraceae bacterium]